MKNKIVTFEEFQKETDLLLENYAIEHGCHVDELHPDFVTAVLHFRSEMWIDYKNQLKQLN